MLMNSYWKVRLNNIDNISDYSNFIHDFFSINGEANKIRYMYNKLHNDEKAFKSIEVVDLNISRTLFNQYEVGFIRHLHMYSRDKNAIGITDIANSKFLNEIFNGSYNKPVNMELKDAVGNLEVLIDLIPDIESMTRNSQMMNVNVCYNSYTSFVNNYLKKMISGIIDTYDEINNILDSSHTKNNNEHKSYKLFV